MMALGKGHTKLGLTGFPILKSTTKTEGLNFIMLIIIFWGESLLLTGICMLGDSMYVCSKTIRLVNYA